MAPAKVMGNFNRQFAKIRLQYLFALAVAGAAYRVLHGAIFAVIQRFSQLGFSAFSTSSCVIFFSNPFFAVPVQGQVQSLP